MHLLSRRHFLFGSAAISLLSSVAITLPQMGSYPDHTLNLKILSNRHVYILRALGDWLIPPDHGLPGSGGDDTTIIAIDTLYRNLPFEQERLMLALPIVFEHGTALDRFGAQRFTKLSLEEKDTYMNNWATATSLTGKQLFVALRAIFALTYFERIDVQESLSTPVSCKI